jgi:predicted RNA-binding protein YlxR (DUF448 family)
MPRKHVPQRTCVACRQVRPKREMIRIVRTSLEGIQIDPGGKRAGRGAYLCRNRSCWEIALKEKRLERALRSGLSDEERAALWDYAQTLEA